MDFDTKTYKVWTWKHPLMLHWMLNPGLAINELVLGQRIPRVSLIEKNNPKSLEEKSFVPCPHCKTIHPALKWSSQNKTAFGNWFGLYCDHCGGIIPCLRNVTSAIVLGITYPVWIWFAKNERKKWLGIQKQKFSQPLKLSTPTYNWILQGLCFGWLMFIFMELVYPLVEGKGYQPLKLLLGIIIWTLAGLLFGYVMKKVLVSQQRSISQKKINE